MRIVRPASAGWARMESETGLVMGDLLAGVNAGGVRRFPDPQIDPQMSPQIDPQIDPQINADSRRLPPSNGKIARGTGLWPEANLRKSALICGSITNRSQWCWSESGRSATQR